MRGFVLLALFALVCSVDLDHTYHRALVSSNRAVQAANQHVEFELKGPALPLAGPVTCKFTMAGGVELKSWVSMSGSEVPQAELEGEVAVGVTFDILGFELNLGLFGRLTAEIEAGEGERNATSAFSSVITSVVFGDRAQKQRQDTIAVLKERHLEYWTKLEETHGLNKLPYREKREKKLALAREQYKKTASYFQAGLQFEAYQGLNKLRGRTRKSKAALPPPAVQDLGAQEWTKRMTYGFVQQTMPELASTLSKLYERARKEYDAQPADKKDREAALVEAQSTSYLVFRHFLKCVDLSDEWQKMLCSLLVYGCFLPEGCTRQGDHTQYIQIIEKTLQHLYPWLWSDGAFENVYSDWTLGNSWIRQLALPPTEFHQWLHAITAPPTDPTYVVNKVKLLGGFGLSVQVKIESIEFEVKARCLFLGEWQWKRDRKESTVVDKEFSHVGGRFQTELSLKWKNFQASVMFELRRNPVVCLGQFEVKLQFPISLDLAKKMNGALAGGNTVFRGFKGLSHLGEPEKEKELEYAKNQLRQLLDELRHLLVDLGVAGIAELTDKMKLLQEWGTWDENMEKPYFLGSSVEQTGAITVSINVETDSCTEKKYEVMLLIGAAEITKYSAGQKVGGEFLGSFEGTYMSGRQVGFWRKPDEEEEPEITTRPRSNTVTKRDPITRPRSNAVPARDLTITRPRSNGLKKKTDDVDSLGASLDHESEQE